MEDADRLIPSLVARAVLVCGAAVACLFLLSGTARADEGDGLLGRTTDALTGTVRAGVEDVDREARETVAAVEQAVASVPQTVDEVAREPVAHVGRVAGGAAGAVDRVVGDLLGPGEGAPTTGPDPVTPTPPDVPADPAAVTPAQPPAAHVDPSRAEDRAGSAPHRNAAVRDLASVRPAPGRAGDGRVSRSGPSAVGTATVTSVPAPLDLAAAPMTDPVRPGAFARGGPVLLGVACQDCTPTTTPSGDSPHLLGLPSAGVSTPRTAAVVLRASTVGGPTSVFDRPDVSPG